MDEYLSKPLKQNHLIQTILKCATLGGHLLEKGRDSRASPKDETPGTGPVAKIANGTKSPPPAGPVSALRPPIEPRAFTTTGPITHGSLESPSLVTAEADDPLSRVSASLSEERRGNSY